jgi:hypothetical protein
VYEPNKIHVIVDALSRLPNITKPIGMFDQTTYVKPFYTELEWMNDVKEFFRT